MSAVTSIVIFSGRFCEHNSLIFCVGFFCPHPYLFIYHFIEGNLSQLTLLIVPYFVFSLTCWSNWKDFLSHTLSWSFTLKYFRALKDFNNVCHGHNLNLFLTTRLILIDLCHLGKCSVLSFTGCGWEAHSPNPSNYEFLDSISFHLFIFCKLANSLLSSFFFLYKILQNIGNINQCILLHF